MNTITAIQDRRSIRSFTSREIEPYKIEQLKQIVRYYPCPANLQPLKFALLKGRTEVLPILPMIRWAIYLPDYSISDDAIPQALFLIFGDTHIASDFGFATGAAATEIMLAGQSLGLSSCCLGIRAKEEVSELLGVDPTRYKLQCLIALGYSNQCSQIEPYSNSCKYWQDKHGNFHVPKYSTQEVFLGAKEQEV